MPTVSRERLAEVFVEVADTLVDDFDLVEFLRTVCTRAAELTGVAAVGLLLSDPSGRLHVMAASDEQAQMLELLQLQSRQGPCLDAFGTGTAVVNVDLRRATPRWPSFAPHATRLGYRSVHAVPLRLRSRVIGALNLFGTGPGRLHPDDVTVLQALADIATIGLLQERTLHRAETLTRQLQAALTSRVVIEQAKGALARTHDVDVDAAFALLRTYARNHHRRIDEVARAVLTHPDSIPELTRRRRDPPRRRR